MTKPKWILDNELLFSQLRLDRFPVPCVVTADVGRGSRGWRHSIRIEISVKDSLNGEEIIIAHSFELGKDSNLKNELLKELLWLIDHEVKETIQFELDGVRKIPFDPHNRIELM
jgi:hypothetical protein